MILANSVWHHWPMSSEGLAPTPTGGWSDPAQVEWYTSRIGKLEARRAGEQILADILPDAPRRVLDLGCGDGRLAALVVECRPSVKEVVAVDVSEPMLQRARDRFATMPIDADVATVHVREWNLQCPITPLGEFDLVVSGFAIHHLDDARKRALFVEVVHQLKPGGMFANLEVVASATPRRHAEFLAAIGRTADDPEDQLVPIEDQLQWMRESGLTEVECLWRWRGFALLVGESK